MTDRRSFLKQAGILAVGLPMAAGAATQPALPTLSKTASSQPIASWPELRQLFTQDPDYIHFSNFLVTTHPRPVQEAIERYRAQIDRNPGLAMDWDLQETWKREAQVRLWAGRYLQAKPEQIALTGSTSEGLAMIYGGLHVRPDQEILTTVHEHYATEFSLTSGCASKAPRSARSSCSRTPARFPAPKYWTPSNAPSAPIPECWA